jgi:hypothetical protein
MKIFKRYLKIFVDIFGILDIYNADTIRRCVVLPRDASYLPWDDERPPSARSRRKTIPCIFQFERY